MHIIYGTKLMFNNNNVENLNCRILWILTQVAVIILLKGCYRISTYMLAVVPFGKGSFEILNPILVIPPTGTL